MVRVTVGGLPGSGTTTACRKLAEQLGLQYVYAGQIFRLLAKEHGMTLTEFGRYCEKNPEVDKELDRRQLEHLKKTNLLLEGRLSGWLAFEHGIPALKIWLDAPVDVRANRIVQREGGDLEEKKAEMLEREFSEAKRYRNYYGVDLDNRTFYDLVIETERKTPDQVVEEIVAALEEMVEEEDEWTMPRVRHD